mgnify:CR=1 FL=1
MQKIYASIQAFWVIGKSTTTGMTDEEMQILSQCFTDPLIANGLIKQKNYQSLRARQMLTQLLKGHTSRPFPNISSYLSPRFIVVTLQPNST